MMSPEMDFTWVVAVGVGVDERPDLVNYKWSGRSRVKYEMRMTAGGAGLSYWLMTAAHCSGWLEAAQSPPTDWGRKSPGEDWCQGRGYHGLMQCCGGRDVVTVSSCDVVMVLQFDGMRIWWCNSVMVWRNDGLTVRQCDSVMLWQRNGVMVWHRASVLVWLCDRMMVWCVTNCLSV